MVPPPVLPVPHLTSLAFEQEEGDDARLHQHRRDGQGVGVEGVTIVKPFEGLGDHGVGPVLRHIAVGQVEADARGQETDDEGDEGDDRHLGPQEGEGGPRQQDGDARQAGPLGQLLPTGGKGGVDDEFHRTAPRTRQAFWPPNPKELESTTRTSARRASLGT